jgi:hypothetical protein
MLASASNIDCNNYTYKWETSMLSCQAGKIQAQRVGNDEIKLGNCYKALDTDLGNSTRSKINECIAEIDEVNSDYNLPIISALLDAKTITDTKNGNVYNKSLLQAALESK